MSGEATQLGRIVIPTAKIPKPGGPRHDTEQQKPETREAEWHGAGILYARKVKDSIELRLYYIHMPQDIIDEIASRFGVGAIEWTEVSD